MTAALTKAAKRTLVVFPTDPLSAYCEKGEVKKGYFNPRNYFTRVVIIDCSPRPLNAAEKHLIHPMVGSAELVVIHYSSKSRFDLISRFASLPKDIAARLAEYKPNCVRAYGCLTEGYIAMRVSRLLRVPFMLSLHTNYDDMRRIYRVSGEYSRFALSCLWKPMERRILRNADQVIAVYGYAKRYALANGANPKQISLIYNKVFPDKFFPGVKRSGALHPLRVVTVMNMIWVKNQECLARSLVGTNGAIHITFIGDGPQRKHLEALVAELGLTGQVKFIYSVQNKDLRKHYVAADVFASAIRTGGVGIPILEAMACGIPVVHARQPDEPSPDVLTGNAMMVKNTPEAFRDAFLRLASDGKMRARLAQKAHAAFLTINGDIMERKEEQLYTKLLR